MRHPVVPKRVRYLAAIHGAAGAATTRDVVRRQAWSTTTYLGLRCGLTDLPDVPPAAVEVRMVRRPPRAFDGFADELRRTRGTDAYEMLLRMWLAEAGVEWLYVAELDGEPVYCQWLVDAEHQPLLERHSPGSYTPLPADEVLLEGAYTFSRFRGRGVMAAG